MRWLVAMATMMVGAIWIAQGLGLLPGTGFMDRDPRWAVVGVGIVAIGLAIGVSAWRARRSS